MEIRELQPGYAVSPQIESADMAAVATAGFRTVICNRPDSENPVALGSAAMRMAAEAAGLVFVYNPVVPGQMSMQNVEAQRAALDGGCVPVFAYCASGNRSSVVWALSQAGRQEPDALIAAAARWGYQLAQLRPQIEALARG